MIPHRAEPPIDVTMTRHYIHARHLPFTLPCWLAKPANDNGEMWA